MPPDAPAFRTRKPIIGALLAPVCVVFVLRPVPAAFAADEADLIFRRSTVSNC